MSWLSSLVVAAIAAAAGLLASGLVASLYTDWYRVSNFEGGAGYAVVFVALFGGIAALIVGLVTARAIAGSANPSFVRALLMSLAIVVGANGVICGVLYISADIPPQIDGEPLHLAFELQWPSSQREDPRLPGRPARVSIGAGSGGSVRTSWEGALALEQAHRDAEGRWVASGVAPVMTTRGRRLLSIAIGDSAVAGFDVPLPATPTVKEREWSAWLPRAKDDKSALPDGFRYRFKVVKTSEPWVTDTLGPFTIETRSRWFTFSESGGGTSGSSTFRVLFKGRLLPEADSVSTVMRAAIEPPSLVVSAPGVPGSTMASRLLVAEGDSLRINVLSAGVDLQAVSLTNLPAPIVDRDSRGGRGGLFDTWTLARAGLYLFRSSVVDTRTLKAMPLVTPDSVRPDDVPGILALSPDARSVVWSVEDSVSLGVTDFVAGKSYLLKVDLDRMRLNDWASMNPDWVLHHFEWKREAQGDVLVERASFTPMPYRGKTRLGPKGDYQSWEIRGVDRTMELAIVGILVQAMGGKHLPPDPTTVGQQVQIGDQKVGVWWSDSGPYVSVIQYSGDPEFMRRIAAALDSALATGQHDRHFIR